MSERNKEQQQGDEEQQTLWSAVGSLLWGAAKAVGWELLVYSSIYLFSRSVVSWLRRNNPQIDDTRGAVLERLVSKSLHDYRAGQDVSYSLLSILSLILGDDQDPVQVYNDIINGNQNGLEVFWTSIFNYGDESPTADVSPEELKKRQLPDDIEFTTKKGIDVNDEYGTLLVQQYGISSEVVTKIPMAIRETLYTSLQSKPQCPISLDDIVDPDTNKVRSGVTMVVQFLNNKPFIFFYDTVVFRQWRNQQHVENPVTRQPIRNKEIVELTPNVEEEE